MYKRILLAADCSRQTLVALREGALIAQIFGATAHLLIIDRAAAGWVTADGLSMVHQPSEGPDLLKLGLERLSRLGVAATGEIRRGDPAQLIATTAARMRVDLVIIGHRRQTFLERWWSASPDSYILDNVQCSVMVAQETISDAQFEAHFLAAPDAK